MIGLIPALGILGFIITAYFSSKDEYTLSDKLEEIFLAFMKSMIVFLLVSLAIMLIIIPFTTDTYEMKPICRWDIKSMKPDQELHGDFVLGSGSINSEPVFYVLTYAGDNFWKKETFPVNNCLITETDEIPHINRIDQITRNKVHKFLFGFHPSMSTPTYKIYVPKGTIIEDYKIM